MVDSSSWILVNSGIDYVEILLDCRDDDVGILLGGGDDASLGEGAEEQHHSIHKEKQNCLTYYL